VRAFFLIFALVLWLPLFCSGQSRLGRYFYGEDKFNRSVAISASMDSAIRKDKNFQDCLPRPADLSDDRFEATEIDLNNDRILEVLVKGECGNSATSYFFWVLSKTHETYRPILFVATMGIGIEKTRTRGYPNISSSGCNANSCLNQIFSFNGQRYVKRREWWGSVDTK
jgi:hypothetical protein